MTEADSLHQIGRAYPDDSSVLVCLDSAEENLTRDLALAAHHLVGGGWNGWSRPVATAEDFSDFLERWSRNDPNGSWGSVRASATNLVYLDRDEDEPEVFPAVGLSETGQVLYDVTGWVWVRLA